MDTQMQEEPSDGGSAFPAMLPGGNYCTPGMSLRDYMAAQAMTGAYAAWMADCRDANVSSHSMAQECYLIADAMLAAREPQPDTATSQQIALGIGGGK